MSFAYYAFDRFSLSLKSLTFTKRNLFRHRNLIRFNLPIRHTRSIDDVSLLIPEVTDYVNVIGNRERFEKCHYIRGYVRGLKKGLAR
jgi:hypothetical protein